MHDSYKFMNLDLKKKFWYTKYACLRSYIWFIQNMEAENHTYVWFIHILHESIHTKVWFVQKYVWFIHQYVWMIQNVWFEDAVGILQPTVFHII